MATAQQQRPAGVQPRTSSLAPSLAAHSQPQQPRGLAATFRLFAQSPQQNDAAAAPQWSWTSLASSLFSQNPEVPSLWEDWEDALAEYALTPTKDDLPRSHIPSVTLESVNEAALNPDLSRFDAVSAQRLLERIERENRALALDPRTVMVQDGTLLTAQETLQTLAVESFAAPLRQDSDDVANQNAQDGHASLSIQAESNYAHETQFWESLFAESDIHAAIARIPHLISARIRDAGIPPQLRPRLWLRLSGANIPNVEQIYSNLLAETSPFEAIITRDITRTFPTIPLFTSDGGEGQKMLFNILRAYSNYDHEVGYCQGLSFCAGLFLMQGYTEQEALAVFIRILEDPSEPSQHLTNERTISPESLIHQLHKSPSFLKLPVSVESESTASTAKPSRASSPLPAIHRPVYALRSCFLPDMAGLHLALYQHSELLKALAPGIDAHLRKCGITSTMYASQWFLTLFSYSFPLSLVFRLIDIMLVEGAMLTMLRFSVGIILLNAACLVEVTEIESLLDRFKGNQLIQGAGRFSTSALIKDALEAGNGINMIILEDLKRKYLSEQRELAAGVSKSQIVRLEELIRELARERESVQIELAAVRHENARLVRANAELRERLQQEDEIRLHMLKDSQVLRARIAQLESCLSASSRPMLPTDTVPPASDDASELTDDTDHDNVVSN